MFFDEGSKADTAPSVYAHWLQTFEVQPTITLFVHLHQVHYPTVLAADRFHIGRMSPLASTFRVLVRHGYNDCSSGDSLASDVIGALERFMTSEMTGTSADASPQFNRATKEYDDLKLALTKRVVFLFGSKTLQPDPNSNILNKMFVHVFGWMRNSLQAKPVSYRLPANQIVLVGRTLVI